MTPHRFVGVGALLLLVLCTLRTPCQSVAILRSVPLPDAPLPRVRVAEAGALSSEEEQPLRLRKLPVRFLSDEAHIFTSPARVRSRDLKWLLPLAGATAASLFTDTYTMRNVVSHNPTFNNAAGNTSEVLRDSFIAVPATMFLAGSVTHSEHTRDAGLLGGEAIIDAYVFSEATKYIALRERPYQDDARGHFFAGDSAGNPSFVSGHTIVAWSSAAVLADEYRRPWQQAGIYTLASGVALTRVLSDNHFPTDVLLGAASGWLIGHYVSRAHRRHELH